MVEMFLPTEKIPEGSKGTAVEEDGMSGEQLSRISKGRSEDGLIWVKRLLRKAQQTCRVRWNTSGGALRQLQFQLEKSPHITSKYDDSLYFKIREQWVLSVSEQEHTSSHDTKWSWSFNVGGLWSRSPEQKTKPPLSLTWQFFIMLLRTVNYSEQDTQYSDYQLAPPHTHTHTYYAVCIYLTVSILSKCTKPSSPLSFILHCFSSWLTWKSKEPGRVCVF